MRLRTAAILLGLTLPLAGGATLSATPLPDTLPGTSTASAPPAASQAPAPAPPADGATPATPAVTVPSGPVSLVGPRTRSSFMKKYQRKLRSKGQRIRITGRWDRATQNATKRMQRKLGMKPNLIVNAPFLSAIGIKMRGVAAATGPLPSAEPNAGVVQVATQYLGVPYRYGGATPAGFDCSGLSMFSYKQIGKSIPRSTWDIWAALPKVPFEQLAAGDLVFFRNLGHMGIYMGDGNVIHAPRTGQVVSIFPLANRMHDYMGAARP